MSRYIPDYKRKIGTVSEKEKEKILGTYQGRERHRKKRLKEKNKKKNNPKRRKKRKMPEKKPVYDPDNKGVKALIKFEKELVENQPIEISDLLYKLGEAYFANIKINGTPKTKKAGENIYQVGFKYVKDEVLHLDSPTDRGRQAIEESVERSLGMNKARLEGIVKEGLRYKATNPHNPDFTKRIAEPTADSLGKYLDSLSIRDLTPAHMNEESKKYLIHRAKALEIEVLLKKYTAPKDITDFDKDFLHMAIMIATHRRNSL